MTAVSPSAWFHTCPAPKCRAQVRHSLLSCSRHWKQLPADLRRQIYATWNNGRGFGTPEHNDAIAAAVAAWTVPAQRQARP